MKTSIRHSIAMAFASLGLNAQGMALPHSRPQYTPNHTRVTGVAAAKRAARKNRNKRRNK